MKKKKQSVTLETLARSIDSLAIMTKAGFDGVDKRFEQVDQRLENLEQGQKALEQGQKTTNQRLEKLEKGQEGIELRLLEVAYRFEVTALEKRVVHLERRAKFPIR